MYFEITRIQVRLPKPNFEHFRIPQKSPNFEPVRTEMGQTYAQIWVCPNQEKLKFEPFRTHLRLPKSNIEHTYRPEYFKNPKLSTHELGFTKHYSGDLL